MRGRHSASPFWNEVTIVIFAAFVAVTLLVPATAFAKGGAGKACKPGMDFQKCQDKCVTLAGGGYPAIKKCANKCSHKVCPGAQ